MFWSDYISLLQQIKKSTELDCELNVYKRFSCPCPGGDLQSFPDIVIKVNDVDLVMKPEHYLEIEEN